MIYKCVGRIKEHISAIGIGCWNMGGDWDSSDERESIRVIHAAIDNGINLFDVAPVYGWGNSERILGKALKGGLRNNVLVASKCGLLWNSEHKTTNNLSYRSMMTEIDETLNRLQTDYVDIYQLHWPDHSVPLEETARALEKMKTTGKIRYVGLSNFAQTDMEKMMSYISVDCQQGLYNMLERNSASYHGIPLEYRTEMDVFPNVRKFGQAYFPYSPMFQGLMAGRFLNGIDFSAKDIRNENPKLVGERFNTYREGARKIKAFADELGRPMNEVSLNWLRQKEEITSIIGGVSNIEQLEQNLRCLTWNLTEEELRRLNEIIASFEAMP